MATAAEGSEKERQDPNVGHTEEGRWIRGYTEAVGSLSHLLHILLASAGCEAAGRGVHVIASRRDYLETAAALLWVESRQDQEKRKQNCSLQLTRLELKEGIRPGNSAKQWGGETPRFGV